MLEHWNVGILLMSPGTLERWNVRATFGQGSDNFCYLSFHIILSVFYKLKLYKNSKNMFYFDQFLFLMNFYILQL